MTKKPRISLQTFTIRKQLQTPAARLRSLERVKSVGLNALELARIPFSPKVISRTAGICRDLGIDILSTQMKLNVIEADLGWTIKLHRMLDCSDCSVSVVDIGALKTEARLNAYADRLNSLGGELKKEGINLLFHHHNFEFVPLRGTDGFSILKERLDPDAVKFVLDTYWLQRSGHNPAAVIRSLSGRVRGIHLRDFALKPPQWAPGITDTELGNGNIDFTDVTSAAAETGCAYMAIEQAATKPWESLDVSIKYLKQIGLADQF